MGRLELREHFGRLVKTPRAAEGEEEDARAARVERRGALARVAAVQRERRLDAPHTQQRAHDERQRFRRGRRGGGRIVEFQHLVRLVELGVFIDARCEVVASIILRVLCGGGRRRRDGRRGRALASRLALSTFAPPLAQLDLRLLLLR